MFPRADTSIPTDTSGFQGQGDTVLKLTDIHMEAVEDPAAEQKVTLKIVVKNRPGTAIDPNKVKILTYFYDLVDGKDIVPDQRADRICVAHTGTHRLGERQIGSAPNDLHAAQSGCPTASHRSVGSCVAR